jgi:SPP1 family predicted phage head-tail adaptor
MKSITIGKLNRRIEIQEETKTSNDYNETISTWSTLRTLWAMLTTRSGYKEYLADQRTYEMNYFFYVRYRTDLHERLRIKYDGKFYKIISIIEPTDFFKQLLEIKAELLPEVEA